MNAVLVLLIFLELNVRSINSKKCVILYYFAGLDLGHDKSNGI